MCPYFGSLRFRLIALVCADLLLVVVLMVFNDLEDRREASGEWEEKL